MKKQSIWVFQWRKSVHYWWSYILFSPECKELTSMLDPLLYRWGVPPVVIRCVHWTMQMWVLQTWIKALGLYIVMPDWWASGIFKYSVFFFFSVKSPRDWNVAHLELPVSSSDIWPRVTLMERSRYGKIHMIQVYCQTSNIRRTKSQNWNDSHLVLELSLPNPLKPCVKSRLKM